MEDSKEGWIEQSWTVVKAIGYELRPFPAPTSKDFRNAATAVKINTQQIFAEVGRVAPGLAGTVKRVHPFHALAVTAWLCGWAGFIRIEFGAVYFIVSAIVMVFVNLGESDEGEWSAYSVFNTGCRALLGTMNAEQFEREIMHQNPAGPAELHDGHEEDFVWVEPPGMRHAADDSDVDHADSDDDGSGAGEGEEMHDAAGVVDAVEGIVEAGPARRGRKVSGKRARRGFEDRLQRREERRQALAALGPDDWD